MAAFMPAIAQETLTVYDGGATDGFVPVYGLYADAYNKCQMIMPADDLSDMLGGVISKITWYLATPAAAAWGGNFQIYLSEVSQTTFIFGDFLDISGATLVYEGPLDGTNETMEIEFAQDYNYGGGNLLISVYETSPGSWKAATFFGASVTGASVSGYSYSGFEFITATQRNFLPKTTFTYDPIGVVVYRKPKNLAVSDITTHSATITWEAGGNETTWGIEYKKAADEEWTSAGTVTEKTIALDALANGVKYDVRVKSIYANGESEWVQISFPTLALEGEGTDVTPTPHPTASTTKWYQIKTQDNCYLYFNWDEERVMATSSPSTDDAYLFCFVRDEADSSIIYIYNRGRQRYMAQGDFTTGSCDNPDIDYVEWNNDGSFFYICFRDYNSYKNYLSYNPGSQYGSIGSKNGSFTASEVVTAPLVTVPYNTLAPIDFHIPHNDLDNEGDEGYAKLIDQNKSTKWCVVNNSDGWETIWMDFESDVWFIPKGYTLTTGNDTGSHNNRNPKEWVIYGKTFEDDDWTELVHVTDGKQAGLGTMSSTEYSFDITGATKGYRYFRFEVRQIRGQEANNKYIFQLAELKLLGTYVDAPEPPIPGDLNGDGQVDISDVNAVINMMLGKTTQTEAGDVTGEGNVDISDVNAVINIMLGKTTPTPPPTEPTAQSLTATGYNAPGNTNNNADENYTKLVDGNRETKWCVVNPSGAWETIWIDLKCDVAFRPTSYIMTTGNDTQSFIARNPKNWKIYGRNSESESWTELVHVTDGAGLGTANTTDYTFQFNGITKAYKFYRFEVIDIGGCDIWNSNYYIFQLGELTLVGY